MSEPTAPDNAASASADPGSTVTDIASIVRRHFASVLQQMPREDHPRTDGEKLIILPAHLDPNNPAIYGAVTSLVNLLPGQLGEQWTSDRVYLTDEHDRISAILRGAAVSVIFHKRAFAHANAAAIEGARSWEQLQKV